MLSSSVKNPENPMPDHLQVADRLSCAPLRRNQQFTDETTTMMMLFNRTYLYIHVLSTSLLYRWLMKIGCACSSWLIKLISSQTDTSSKITTAGISFHSCHMRQLLNTEWKWKMWPFPRACLIGQCNSVISEHAWWTCNFNTYRCMHITVFSQA